MFNGVPYEHFIKQSRRWCTFKDKVTDVDYDEAVVDWEQLESASDSESSESDAN